MNAGGILDPDLFDTLSEMYPSVATVQRATVTRDAEGGEAYTWADLADHVGIACRLSPVVGTTGGENRRPDQTVTIADRWLSLAGRFPTIRTDDRVMVDGSTFGIVSVDGDGQGAYTRLRLEVVS